MEVPRRRRHGTPRIDAVDPVDAIGSGRPDPRGEISSPATSVDSRSLAGPQKPTVIGAILAAGTPPVIPFLGVDLAGGGGSTDRDNGVIRADTGAVFTPAFNLGNQRNISFATSSDGTSIIAVGETTKSPAGSGRTGNGILRFFISPDLLPIQASESTVIDEDISAIVFSPDIDQLGTSGFTLWFKSAAVPDQFVGVWESFGSVWVPGKTFLTFLISCALKSGVHSPVPR